MNRDTLSATTPAPTRRWHLLAIALIAGTWMWSGLAKWSDLEGFHRALQAWDLLPTAWNWNAAHVIPRSECLLAIAVLIPWTRRSALILSIFALLIFAIALIIAASRGITSTCGCFGAADPFTWPWNLVRNIVLITLALWALHHGRRTDHASP